MRLALIADIHGNLVALETVLQELAQEGIDQILCLGDVGSLGPQPHEVIGRLRQLGCRGVLGNTDAWLLAGVPAVENNPPVAALNAWCADQLTPDDRAYLQALPLSLELPLDAKRTVRGYHGSPRSFDDVIAAVTPTAALTEMLGGQVARVMAGGHTHTQMIRRHADAQLVNAGSVGLPGVSPGGPDLPPHQNVHWAEYGVLAVENGRVSIELRRTPLDMPAVLEAGRRAGMPHYDWWRQKWQAD